MLFENDKEKSVKVRLGEPGKYRWISVNPGEEVDIPKGYGENLGLKEVKKGLPGAKKKDGLKKKAKNVLNKLKPGAKKKPNKKADPKAKAQVKPLDEEIDPKEVSYEERLESINGIGSERVKDILKVYPTETAMITAINNGLRMPFRNDVVEKIKEEFKKKA